MAAKANKEAEPEPKEEAEGDGEAQPKRKLPRKLIIIAAAAVLVLGGGGTAAFLMLGGKKEEKAAAPVVKPVAFFDLPEVMVNLSGAGAGTERAQYLKVKVVLELPDQTLGAQIQPIMPRLMDTFQTYLRELRPTDLEGSAGIYRLRDELTRRVNTMLAPHRINAVLFKEIVVQ
jgi:flagellar protein FliL